MSDSSIISKISEFIKGVKVEFGKISWPSPKDTLMAAFIVLGAVLFSGTLIGLVDYIANIVIRFIIRL